MNKDVLEIFLITYNRRNFLEVTLNKIFSEGSPIKDYAITILDNNSNDGTEELCRAFANQFSNMNYVRNRRNIGLAGNICKAMENASKKYFWILCDNDDLDFSAWNDVERFMEEDKDLIITCRDYYEGKDKLFEAFVLNQLTFLPGGIYKTEHLTDNVMCYAVADTHTILPHLPLGCAIINKNGNIALVSKSIVTLTSNVKIENSKTYDFDRLKKDDSIAKNERTKSLNFPAGIVISFDSCQDNKIRETAISNFTRVINGKHGPFISPINILMSNCPKYIRKEFETKLPINLKIEYYVLKIIKIIFYFIYFYKGKNNDIYVCIFNKIKTKIWSSSWIGLGIKTKKV